MSTNGTASHVTKRFRTDPAEAGAGSKRGLSGRIVVPVLCISILALWAVLYLAFRDWRVRRAERAKVAARHVEETIIPLLAPLLDLRPEGITEPEWKDATSATAALLDRLASSGEYEPADLDRVRDDLAKLRANAVRTTALADLVALWDRVQHAGPAAVHNMERPPILTAMPALLDPLLKVKPERLGGQEWYDIVRGPALKLEAIERAGMGAAADRQALRIAILRIVSAARLRKMPVRDAVSQIDSLADAFYRRIRETKGNGGRGVSSSG